MEKPHVTMAQQVARAASDFQRQRTGRAPRSATVVLSEKTLVVTLQGALSPAEQALAQSPAGATQVQEFHRQLFTSSCEPLRQEIKRITGVEVREANAETMVQVFLLANGVPVEAFSQASSEIRALASTLEAAKTQLLEESTVPLEIEAATAILEHGTEAYGAASAPPGGSVPGPVALSASQGVESWETDGGATCSPVHRS